MKKVEGLTSDGRAAYGTGTTKTQPVYKQHCGKYVRGADGKPIVVGYRVRRHEYIFVDGERVKTPWVSVQVEKHPKKMSPSEVLALNRQLSDLLDCKLKTFVGLRMATQEIVALNEAEEVDHERFSKLSPKMEKLVKAAQDNSDQASKAAIARLLQEVERFAARANEQADALGRQVETEEAEIAEMERNLQRASEVKRRGERLNTLSVAALSYIADKEGVRAGPQTRGTYKGYLRNHILVPTAIGRTALGDLPVGGITKKDLQAFERSLYSDRDGYRLKCDPMKIDIKGWLMNDDDLPISNHRQEKLMPRTAHKVLKFVASVVEWCRQEPDRWGITSPVNTVQAYKPIKKPSTSRRQGAPRTARFLHLVEAAEANGLGWMVPLMALVRLTYRPSEARGLRWADLTEVYGWDGRKRMAFRLMGTIANASGGEKWVPEGKTEEATGQTVEVPEYILTILRKHRIDGSDYVVAPPKKTGKNANRRVKAFMTKHDVEDGWRRLKELAGVPAQTDLYTLKHGMIAELLLQGHKPEVVTLLTRHTTIDMVMRVYASIQAGDLCDAIETMHRDTQEVQDDEEGTEAAAIQSQ